MQYAVLPILLFLACVVALAVGLLVVANLFNPGRPGRVSRMPYESGMDPIHDTRRRFDVRFNLLAIAFLVFDVELLFLYPWAVASHSERREERVEGRGMDTSVSTENRIPSPQPLVPGRSSLSPLPSPHSPPRGIDAAVAGGLIESRNLVFAGAMTFIALLGVGFIYDWRKGVFLWR